MKKFKYEPPQDNWGELLLPGQCDDFEPPDKLLKVKCKKIYYDVEFQREMKYGETWEVEARRADILSDLGLVSIMSDSNG